MITCFPQPQGTWGGGDGVGDGDKPVPSSPLSYSINHLLCLPLAAPLEITLSTVDCLHSQPILGLGLGAQVDISGPA